MRLPSHHRGDCQGSKNQDYDSTHSEKIIEVVSGVMTALTAFRLVLIEVRTTRQDYADQATRHSAISKVRRRRTKPPKQAPQIRQLTRRMHWESTVRLVQSCRSPARVLEVHNRQNVRQLFQDYCVGQSIWFPGNFSGYDTRTTRCCAGRPGTRYACHHDATEPSAAAEGRPGKLLPAFLTYDNQSN